MDEAETGGDEPPRIVNSGLMFPESPMTVHRVSELDAEREIGTI